MRHRRFGHAGPVVVLAMTAAVLPLTVGQARAALPGKAGPLLAGVVISGSHQGVATENVDGSNLVTFPGGGGVGLDQGQNPAWAPDGSRVLFQSGDGGLVASLPDGSGAYTLDAGVDATPAYSREGAYVFAATTPSPGAQSRLEFTPSSWNVADHQGSGDMKPWFASATGGSDRFPSISRSTGAVVYEHDANGRSDLWTDHGSRSAGLLIADGAQPDVSPDGKKIVFVRRVPGYDQLFVQAADGSGSATQLTSNAANHDYPGVGVPWAGPV